MFGLSSLLGMFGKGATNASSLGLSGIVSKFLGFLSGKSLDNPKTTNWLVTLGTLGSVVGIRPETLTDIAVTLTDIAAMLQKMATLLQ